MSNKTMMLAVAIMLILFVPSLAFMGYINLRNGNTCRKLYGKNAIWEGRSGMNGCVVKTWKPLE
jgi:hypothetical protein